MSTSESLSPPRSTDPVLATSAMAATTELTLDRDSHEASHAADAPQILLRGTRRSVSMIPRFGNGLRAQVRLPEQRKDGASAYIKQWLLTSIPLAVTDIVVLLTAVSICAAIGLQWLNPEDPTSRATVWFPSIALTWLLINAALRLYPGIRLGLVDEIRLLTLSLSIVASVTLGRIVTSSWLYERSLFLGCAYALCVVLAPSARSIVRKALAKSSWWGFPAIVCGDDTVAFNVDQWLMNNRRLGLRPVGVIANPAILELEGDSPRYLGAWSDARTIAEDKHAFWGIVVEPDVTERIQLGMTNAVEQFLGNVPHIFVVSRLTGLPDAWNRHQMDEGLDGIPVEQHLMLPIPQLVKRGMDLAIATVVAIMLAPLFLVLGIATKLTSPGPIFYGHKRVGRGNTRFKAWKFRTMIANADSVLEDYLARHPELHEEWSRDHKLKNDPRVTALGKWMRKWSIDELPQVWNVIVGEMSVVGPRPIVDAEIAKYGPHFEAFNSVLPGITGLWQVCGRNDTTYDERVQLDVYYVHHWSPWLDLYLLGRTFKTVFFTKGAY
jgi:Undecaprenyl-phosphate galactose phosphotransferase WbaP